MANRFCTECGKELITGNKFCIYCGNKIEVKAQEAIVDTVKTMRQIVGNTSFASAIGGEMIFIQQIPSTNKILSTIGPIRYLFNSIVSIFKNFKQIFRNKKKFILVIIMTIIWIALTILQTFGITGTPIRYLSFLTFARGGMSQGLSRVIGGTLGKGLFAYFVTSLVLPIFSGEKPFKGVGVGIKTLFSSLAIKEIKGLTLILLGGGISLISYNFLTGNGAMINSMPGIVGFILSLRALSRKSGFLRGFIISIGNKFSKKKHVDSLYINKIISGFTIGFGLSIPLSTIGFSYTCYFTGGLCIGISILLKIVVGNRKGVEKA